MEAGIGKMGLQARELLKISSKLPSEGNNPADKLILDFQPKKHKTEAML